MYVYHPYSLLEQKLVQKIFLSPNVEKHKQENHFIQTHTTQYPTSVPTWDMFS